MAQVSRATVDLVKDIYEFRNMPQSPSDTIAAISAIGLSMADVAANPDLAFEAGIARNFRRACDALDIPISPHQSLTLAKHLRVGGEAYRTGIPLSDHERYIALHLYRIALRAYCEEQGEVFSDAEVRACEQMVDFGERGLHIGHKIGEASGCFQVIVLAVLSLGTASALSFLIHLLQKAA
jgi:hypothetical protein